MSDRIWLWFADNGNIRKWQREPFPEGTGYVIAAQADAELEEMTRSCLAERAGAASLRSKLEEAEGALERLLNAKALSNVRSLVAGWNGEDRPDGPFKERHPSRLGARIETNCGRVYELDEAMHDARRALASLREADHA